MKASRLDIRLGSTTVDARFHAGRGAVQMQREPIDGEAADVALHALLGRLMRRPRFTSPHVCVSIAGPQVRAGVLRFDTLPRKSGDRALIVTQRFCREHKLDAKTTAVAFSVHRPAKSVAATVLACALPRSLVDSVTATLATHNLYGDVITSELSLALAALQPRHTALPGVLTVVAEQGCTMLLMGAGGQPLSVARLTNGGDGTLTARHVARVRRYAGQLGVEPASLACHIYEAAASETGLHAALRALGGPVHVAAPWSAAREPMVAA